MEPLKQEWNKKMIYHKLVRDKIPEHIIKMGGMPITHIANDTEYWQKLKEKLSEEVAEFEKDENIEELADVAEVIEAIIKYKRFSKEEIKKEQEKKAKERGKFDLKIILDES
jgi:predicted house-cleaning noncanonical NTP pyrophosphatase (MazG superfamily)